MEVKKILIASTYSTFLNPNTTIKNGTSCIFTLILCVL